MPASVLAALLLYPEMAELVGSTPKTATSELEAMFEALLMRSAAVRNVCQPGQRFEVHVATLVLTPRPEQAYGESLGSPWCALSRPEAMMGPPSSPSEESCIPLPLAPMVHPKPLSGSDVPVRLTQRRPLLADATMIGAALRPPVNFTPAM